MGRNVTIKDIAKKAGVSETTVSLSFREESRISDETKRKIQKIALEMNYVQNNLAKSLRGGRSRTLCFVVNDIFDSFYSKMVKVANQLSEKYDYQLLLASNAWEKENAVKIANTMVAKQVEGVILSLNEKEKESLEILNRAEIPYVVIDTIPREYDGSFVINNEIRIGEIAAEYLLEKGCKKIALVTASEANSQLSSIQLQIKGFVDFLKKKAIQFDFSDIYYEGLDINAGKRAINRMNSKLDLYDGIFCVNDSVAYGVIDAVETRGYVVGKDISIIGVDDLSASSLDRISLTSIKSDYEKMTELAFFSLIDRIENSSKEYEKVQIVLEPCLVRRKS